jgi:hypothetical protein
LPEFSGFPLSAFRFFQPHLSGRGPSSIMATVSRSFSSTV